MAEVAFALHLGDGVYLDSNGNVQLKSVPDTVIYEAEFKLPVDPKKAGDALKSVRDALKDIDKNPEALAKFIEMGFDLKLLGLLSTISKIAGTVAPVLAVVGFAFDLAKMFGLFKDGPSALEVLMTNRFNALQTQVNAVAELIVSQNLESGRDAVKLFTSSVRDHVNQLNNTNPNPAELLAGHSDLISSHNAQVAGMLRLVNATSYQTIFDSRKHTRVWMLMQHHLFTHPGGLGTLPAPARLPPDNERTFDHRLALPLASFSGAGYLTAIRGIVPEYRTTGDFSARLREFATAIEALANQMRLMVLARTIYSPADFSVELYESEVIIIPGLPRPIAVAIAPTCSRFPVGAIDLRFHDNDFFGPFLTALFKAEFYGWPRQTRQGGIEFRWLPPATLEFAGNQTAGDNRYRITNPVECAAAANAQSELDYAELLAISGYTELMQLATLFRSESTEPNRSQTVQIKTPDLTRLPQPAFPATVQSVIKLTGIITSDASREPQKCSASIGVWTQPIKRVRPVTYKVRLRTLRSINYNRWHEPDYSAFQSVDYQTDFADRRFKKLHIDERDSALDSELLISGSSPREKIPSVEGVATLKAHTFDWWIPIKSPFSLTVQLEQTASILRGIGHDTATLITKPATLTSSRIMTDPGRRFARLSDRIDIDEGFPSYSALDGGQNWEGEHRDVLEKEITLKWKLRWQADRMHIQLEADPADRNYVVYVVVEEQLQGGEGLILHTAMPVPINGQLTYVPQSFFDEERKAIEKLAKTASEFNRHYSISATVGPSDPIVGWLRPGDLASIDRLERFVSLAEEHEPQLLRSTLQSLDQTMAEPTAY